MSEGGNWYILIAGLAPIDKPLTLASGVSLRPLENRLTVFDLAGAGAVGFRAWAVLEPVAPACVCELESAEDAGVLPGYDALNRAWLASTLLVLRGYVNHVCVACSKYSWNLVAGHQERTSHILNRQLKEEGVDSAVFGSARDLPRFSGDLLDYHLKLLSLSSVKNGPVSTEDAEWSNRHFETFNRLAAQSEAFRLALGASVDWRYAKDRRGAISRLWSGVEAIFGISSELVYRISLLSASLLVPRGPERRERFRQIKKLYGLRSKAVHGGAMSDQNLVDAVEGSCRLLADLLLVCIERGRVLTEDDFDKAVFD